MSRRDRSQAPFSLFAFQDIITSVTGIVILITLMLTLELLQQQPSSTSPSAAVVRQVRTALASTEKTAAALRAQLAQGDHAAAAMAMISPTQLMRSRHEATQGIEQLEQELDRLQEQFAVATAAHDTIAAQLFDRAEDTKMLESLRAEIEHITVELETLKKSNRLIYNPADASQRAWLVDVSRDRLLVAVTGEKSRPRIFTGGLLRLPTSQFMRWAEAETDASDYFVLLVRPGALEVFRDLQKQLEARRRVFGFDLIAADAVVIDPEHGAGE